MTKQDQSHVVTEFTAMLDEDEEAGQLIGDRQVAEKSYSFDDVKRARKREVTRDVVLGERDGPCVEECGYKKIRICDRRKKNNVGKRLV